MSENKFGIASLLLITTALTDAILAIDGLVAHDGILSLFKYAHDFSALSGLSFEAVKNEVADLSPEEREQLTVAIKSKLELHNEKLSEKLKEGVDILDEVINLGCEAYALYQKGVELVGKAKGLVTA